MPHSATSCPPTTDPRTIETFSPGHLGELTRVVPPDMIDAALDTAGGREQRLRRLPSRVVIYLLLAGALFAGQGWQQVWARLTAHSVTAIRAPARSTLTEAMRRVGPRPLRELFTLMAGPGITQATQGARFAGRQVIAIDGTQLAIPDTEMNRMAFPKPHSGPNGEAGYPTVRLVTLLATGTRSMIEAVFGSDQVGELSYAARLAQALRPGMLLLGDRNFASAGFYSQITRAGADFLIRGKTGNAQGVMKLPARKRFTDGSYLSDVRGIPVRVIDANITITTDSLTRTSIYRLITTLLDPHEAPATHLIQLYHDRWEIETAYCELKSVLLGGKVLRARYASGIEQEIWALLVTYQAIRTSMTDAILDQANIDPDRLSFTIALRTARDQLVQTTGTIETNRVDLTGRIGSALLDALLPKRRIRTRPRIIKRAISKYRAKGRDIDRRTYPATLHTEILTPTSDP